MNNIYQPIIFESQNKDIKIEFTKEKVNRNFSFAKTDSEDRYLYHTACVYIQKEARRRNIDLKEND